MKNVVLALLVLLAISVHAYSEMPQVVYFTPADVSEPSQRDIEDKRRIMTKVQQFFGHQMSNNGYGYKTFELETQDTAVVIHRLKGDLDLREYSDENLIVDEVSDKLEHESNIRRRTTVVFVAGSEQIADGALHIWRCEQAKGLTCADYCLIPAESHAAVHYTAHEMAHAFGLEHNSESDDFLMHRDINLRGDVELETKELFCHEAEWLSYNKHFSTDRKIVLAPDISTTYNLDPIEIGGKQIVQFVVSVEDSFPVRLAQLVNTQSGEIISWSKIVDRENTTEFHVNRDLIQGVDEMRVSIIDSHGNRAIRYYTLSEDIGEILPVADESMDYFYLSLEIDNEDSIQPINNADEWDAWTGPWERRVNGTIPPAPREYLNFPFMRTWDRWIYSHAPSRTVWDLSDNDYIRFECRFYLPNPCNPSVAMILFADGEEFYNSRRLTRGNAQNRLISVELPAGIDELEMVVDELENNSCDHYVIGEPRVYVDPAAAAPSIRAIVKKKAIVWGELKK